MIQRRNREITIFSLSAIDLFCSGMGAVMVVMVLLLPYYGKTSTLPPEPVPDPPSAPETPPEPAPAQPVPEPIPAPEPSVSGATIRVEDLDLVFVIDATMSMDEEINSVKSGMASLVQVLRHLSDDVRVGFIAYVDREVPWTTRLLPVNRGRDGDCNLARLMETIDAVELVGNEDWPEHVYGGLQKAVALDWGPRGERRQLIVVIGDALTHPEHVRASLDLASRWVGASEKRGISVVNTGDDLPTKPYFMELAKRGRGRYLESQGDLVDDILGLVVVR